MRKLFFLLCIGCLFLGCKKDKKPPVVLSPVKALLVFPAQDALCTQGTVISGTQSTLAFTWSAADNADSYILSLKNLLTGTTATQTASTNHAAITVLRNTPYSWFVTSVSSKTTVTAQSDIWKFYNSGPGVVSYAPFPAELLTPVLGQNVTAVNGKISLDWNGSDVDNDIAGYDVYFGTTAAPSLYQSNLTDTILNNIAVTSGATYYWKIVTRDAKGNTSESAVFQFTVN
jgi:hypothetical protein